MAGEKTPASLDAGDWVVITFIFGFAIAGAVYVFRHPSEVNFGAWIGTLSVSGGIFHWLRVRDSKQADACGGQQ
jgi:hypothetical protein